MDDIELDPVMERVKALMEEQRLRWSDIGHALNASPQRLYNWRKKGGIPASAYPALAELLGCSIDYLVRGVGEGQRYDLPPRPTEWAKLSTPARQFVGMVIHLSIAGSLGDADIRFMDDMTRRLVHGNHAASDKNTPAPNGARDDWLIGGPESGRIRKLRDQ